MPSRVTGPNHHPKFRHRGRSLSPTKHLLKRTKSASVQIPRPIAVRRLSDVAHARNLASCSVGTAMDAHQAVPSSKSGR